MFRTAAAIFGASVQTVPVVQEVHLEASRAEVILGHAEIVLLQLDFDIRRLPLLLNFFSGFSPNA